LISSLTEQELGIVALVRRYSAGVYFRMAPCAYENKAFVRT